jgi:hypothetical protein
MKNYGKIFFNLRLFSCAGMNTTREKPIKMISNVKKMLLTPLFIMELKLFQNQKLQEMALKSIKRLILSIDGASSVSRYLQFYKKLPV